MCDYSCGNFCISDCTAYANSHSLDGTGSCACSGEHGCWETCYMRCTNGYCGSDCNRMCTGGYCSYQCSYGCGAGKFYSTLNIVFILYSK